MEIKIVLTLEETNLVLAALGTKPFAEVAELITKIKAQGESQIKATQHQPTNVEEATQQVEAVIEKKTKKK